MEYYNKYYEGVFWIPENEKCKIIATLFINNRGVATISSLQPLLRKEEKATDRDWSKMDVVLGFINSHDDSKTYSIKLYDTQKNLQSIGALNKYKYISHNVFVADIYDNNICEESYNSIMLNSNLINNWISKTGFKADKNFSEKFIVNQLYEQPEQIELFENNDFHIYVYFRANYGYPLRRKSYIQEEVFINIETTNNYAIKELVRMGNTIERLFNILLFIPFHSDNIEYKSVSKKTYKLLTKPKELNKHIKNEIDFELFQEKSQEIFHYWFEKQTKLELIIKNFFSVYGQKGVLVENRFLTYVSIIENYHRKNISIEDTKTVLNKYFETVKLRKYNKIETPNLQQRLIYIFDKSSVTSNIDDLKRYTEILKDTRDFHTHLLDNKEEKSLAWQDINKANQLFEVIIREILLKEIGITDFNQNINHLPKIKVVDLELNSKKVK